MFWALFGHTLDLQTIVHFYSEHCTLCFCESLDWKRGPMKTRNWRSTDVGPWLSPRHRTQSQSQPAQYLKSHRPLCAFECNWPSLSSSVQYQLDEFNHTANVMSTTVVLGSQFGDEGMFVTQTAPRSTRAPLTNV